MSKIALITDQHFGARGDNLAFDNFFRKFYRECFFPEIDKRGIKTVVCLGDTFDRRKYINFATLKSCREYWFDELAKRNIKLIMIVGNHDVAFKNTNDVNSPELLLPDYDNVKAYSSPTVVSFDGLDIQLMPWICTDNYNECMDTIKNTKAKVCFGHFEIAGFQMYKGHENDEGFDPKIFQKFDMVCSGHFHHRSSNGNINYLGNPYELTWADFEDPRGFHLFDTDTKKLEFIQNPFTIFHKIYYDDSSGQNKPVDLSAVKDSHVKLIVVHKSNFYEFDKFIEALYQQNPLELKIIEDFSEYEANTLFDDNTVDVEDTLTLLSHYVDNLDTEADKARIKTIMKTLYVEAQTYDNE